MKSKNADSELGPGLNSNPDKEPSGDKLRDCHSIVIIYAVLGYTEKTETLTLIKCSMSTHFNCIS